MTVWPLGEGRKVTSPFGPRDGGFHFGVDFGRTGGSANMPVYAPQSGTVLYAGAAQGYGGPDPCGWLVIQSVGGVWELGHIRRLPNVTVGSKVVEGQQIAVINPDSNTNGGTAPHLHVSYMAGSYDPARKSDPLRVLAGAKEPGGVVMGWNGDPVWLADVLRGYRSPPLRVAELPNWQQYGHGDFRDIWGVMIHHTGNANADAVSIRNGRPDLPGPLSALHIAQNGVVTVVAAGVSWHAGSGSYPGIPNDMANYHLIGIECAWPRDTSITSATQGRELWPDAQIIAMRDSVAAILNRLGFNSSRVIGHKEWAGRAQGKWDPGNLDMNWFRGEVAKAQRGEFAPAIKPTGQNDAKQWPKDFTDRELLEDVWRRVSALK